MPKSTLQKMTTRPRIPEPTSKRTEPRNRTRPKGALRTFHLLPILPGVSYTSLIGAKGNTSGNGLST